MKVPGGKLCQENLPLGIVPNIPIPQDLQKMDHMLKYSISIGITERFNFTVA
jgi:hypothetical protein